MRDMRTQSNSFHVAFTVAALILSVTALLIPYADAKVYIDIDSPGLRRLPLAVLSLDPPAGAAACQDPKLSVNLEEVLLQDLEVSGYFRILSPDVFLVNKGDVNLHPGKIDFRAWSLIGAEALILLRTMCQAGEMETDAQLLDVLTGELLTWKRYKSESSGYRRVAHRFANEVAKELTGVPGAFDTRIAYISNAGGSKELYTIDYDGNAPRKLTEMHSIALSPNWSGDGSRIVFTSYWQRNPGLCVLDLKGSSPLKRLLPGFSPLCSGGAWSNDDAWIAFSASLEGNTELFRIRVGEEGKPQRLTKNWAIDVSPSWSPDGRHIVFVSDRAGGPDLYILELESGKERRLTFEGSYNADPEWSRRGDAITYVSRVGGSFQVFRIRPDGTETMQLTDGACDHLKPTWSPDGRLIAFSSNPGQSFDLYLMRADGTGVKRITWSSHDETDPAWSPANRP
jgi:TolB protein